MLWSPFRTGAGEVRGRRPLVGWAVLTACIFLGSGCDLNGLVDIGDSLLDPDSALLDHPGRQLVKGHYSELKIAGSAENGGYVLARRHDADDPVVALVPFLEGDPCEYGPAFGYDRFSSRVDIELPGTISVQVDQNPQNPGLGTVRFIDYECQEVIEEIPNTAMPGPLFPGVDPFGMLARSSDGTLYLVDVKERKRRLVAPLVDYGVVAGSLLFTLESGEVVIRDEDLNEVDRVGTGVHSLVATGGSRLALAYVDESGMHAWSEKGEVTSLGAEACSPWFIGLDAIAYHDPCDTLRLAITLPSDFAFGEEEAEGMVTLRGPENAVLSSLTMTPGIAKAPTALSEIIVVMAESAETKAGNLLAMSVPEEATPDESDVQLGAVSVASNASYLPEHGVYYRDYEGGVGTLIDFERDGDGHVTGAVNLADRVAWVPYATPYSFRGVLADYDGEQGSLVRLARRKDGSVKRDVLGEDVPLQNFVGDYETEMVAYVAEVDKDGLGILTIVDDLGPYQAVDDVLMNEIDSLDDPEGVVFTSPSDVDGTFELHAWLIEAELDLVIHEAASEYIAIPWPSPGVLYAVPEGDDAGLWFAKAR